MLFYFSSSFFDALFVGWISIWLPLYLDPLSYLPRLVKWYNIQPECECTFQTSLNTGEITFSSWISCFHLMSWMFVCFFSKVDNSNLNKQSDCYFLVFPIVFFWSLTEFSSCGRYIWSWISLKYGYRYDFLVSWNNQLFQNHPSQFETRVISENARWKLRWKLNIPILQNEPR